MPRRLSVRIKPNSKSPSVQKVTDGEFVVAVREPPREDAANQAVIASLARYFDVPRSAIRIIRGHHARQKIIELD